MSRVLAAIVRALNIMPGVYTKSNTRTRFSDERHFESELPCRLGGRSGSRLTLAKDNSPTNVWDFNEAFRFLLHEIMHGLANAAFRFRRIEIMEHEIATKGKSWIEEL